MNPSLRASIEFLGATQTVTGSRYLVDTGRARVLVDCGLFQGTKNLRKRNWQPFPMEPSSIDAVVLTHAHVDHSGYLPALAKQGFTGPIFCSEGTHQLAKIILPDSGHLQEEEAEFRNRHGLTKHHPALPLYTEQDALKCLEQFRPVPFHKSVRVAGDISAELYRAGHILGASSVLLNAAGRRILFSGDVGRPNDLIMKAPEPPPACDYLVVESTYGNRIHPHVDVFEEVGRLVQDTLSKGGQVLVPAFAVGRAQAIMYVLHELMRTHRIPRIPIYLDSPMAIRASSAYLGKANAGIRLSPKVAAAIHADTHYARTVDESKALNRLRYPAVIISASGMATGGRVLHHLQRMLPDHRNTVLFAGYQAPGTRGSLLVNGADRIKIFGAYVPVRARVACLDVLSAHADAGELIDWMRGMPAPPKRVWVTHGEPEAADALRLRIQDELGWHAEVPELGDQYHI